MYELDRARRFEHPFTLVHVRVVEPRTAAHDDHEIERFLRRHVRAIDHSWVTDDGVTTLAVEADGEQVTGLVDRVQRLIAESTPDVAPWRSARIRLSTVSFPRDALTASRLMSALSETEYVVAEWHGRSWQRTVDLPTPGGTEPS